jgi:hypothetical protein
MLASAGYLLRRPGKLLRALSAPLEGDPDIPMLEIQIGRVRGFLRNRRTYRAAREQVRQFFASSVAEAPLDKCASSSPVWPATSAAIPPKPWREPTSSR